MKRLTVLLLAFCLIVSFGFSALAEETPLSRSDAAETFEQGRKAVRGDIKVVDLHGTWREMGR